MNIQISLIVVGFIALGVIGLFLIIKSFYLPKNFYKNRIEREQLLKEKIISVMYGNREEVEVHDEEEMEEEEVAQTSAG